MTLKIKRKTILQLCKNLLLIVLLFIYHLSSLRAQSSFQVSSENICYGDSSVVVFVEKYDSLVWQENTSLGWQNIVRTNSSFRLNGDSIVLYNTKGNETVEIRCLIDSNGKKGIDAISQQVKVYKVSRLNSVSLNGNQNVCFNAKPAVITASHASLSVADGVYYLWYQSNGSGFNLIDSTSSAKLRLNLQKDSSLVYCNIKSLHGCYNISSDTVLIGVFNEYKTATLKAAKDTICFNESLGKLETFSKPTGGDGKYSYQWLISNNGIDFKNIVGAISDSLVVGNLRKTVYYKMVNSDSKKCGLDTTSVLKIKVLDSVQNAKLYGNSTICYNANTDTIGVKEDASGGGLLRYAWQTYDGSSWNDTLSGKKAFTIANLKKTTKLRLKITSLNSCGIYYSDTVIISVLTNYAPGILNSNQSICFDSKPSSVLFNTKPKGAGDDFSYQWQLSRNGVNFKDTLGTTLDSLNLPKQRKTVFVRCLITASSGCKIDTSRVLKVSVFERLEAALLPLLDTQCFASKKDTIIPLRFASGGGDKYKYRWFEDSGNGFSQLTDLKSKDSTLLIGNLKRSTDYYVEVESLEGCGNAKSNIYKVIVLDSIYSPIIGKSQTICFGHAIDTIKLLKRAEGGGDMFDYTWQSQGSNWVDILNTNEENLHLQNLKESFSVRLRAISRANCGEVFSETVEVNVLDSISVGVLDSVMPVCFNDDSKPIFFKSKTTGANNDFSYNWQLSADASVYQNISTRTDSISLLALKESKYVRTQIVSNIGCGSFYSNVVFVEVFDSLKQGEIILDAPDSVCFGKLMGDLKQFILPKGGGDVFTYQWQKQLNGGTWQNVNNGDAAILGKRRIYDSKSLRLMSSSVYGCGTVSSNVIDVKRLMKPDTNQVIGDSLVCSNSLANYYKLKNRILGYEYTWYLKNGFVQNYQSDKTAGSIKWGNYQFQDTVKIEIYSPKTGCNILIPFPVKTNGFYAPILGDIIQKENSSILVYNDSSINLNYSWGLTSKDDSATTEFKNWDYRYYKYPNAIDTSKNKYWVDVWKSDQSCTTRTYFHKAHWSGAANKVKMHKDYTVAQNPVHDNLILFNGSYSQSLDIYIFNTKGQLEKSFFNESGKSLKLEVAELPKGIYFVSVRDKSDIVSTFKILKI